jgi:hypothetical protein
MTSPFVPITLFVTLVLSACAAVPLAEEAPALVPVALGGFFASLIGLAVAVLRADEAADPHRRLVRAADRFEQRWPRFEREFWAHVAAAEARAEAE